MKINCVNPLHTDATPSMHVYGNRTYCFVCGFSVPSSEVVGAEDLKNLSKKPTDIKAEIDYITSLPKREVRGLQLHYDFGGYYILWPDLSFYKKRLSNGRVRYLGPRGIRPSLFKIDNDNKKSLAVVEGELNALSLSVVENKLDIVSPGSANEISRHLPFYLSYENIVIIVDYDRIGVKSGLQLKDTLLKHKKRVRLIAVKDDFNEILQKEGKKGLYKWCQENLAMFTGV